MSPESKATVETLTRIGKSAADKTNLDRAKRRLADSKVGVARIEKVIRSSGAKTN
jgi:hypothetical protein